MHLYDLSVALSDDTPTYPGDPGIQIREWSTLASGDKANVSLLEFGAHTGTHVDAPAHFLAGAGKVENLSLDILIGGLRSLRCRTVGMSSTKLSWRKTANAGRLAYFSKHATRPSGMSHDPVFEPIIPI